MTDLEKYYNKFNEDHRLKTRHGIVEFTTTMKFIHDFIGNRKNLRILDVGAGTGNYSVSLAAEGYSVTAVELVKKNLEVLQSKHAIVNCWQGNALDLNFLEAESFDITLMLGPLYHLHSFEQMTAALKEASRVTKQGGYIFSGYVMNEYSVLTYCFKQKHIMEVINKGSLTDDFHTVWAEDELYSYFRLEDIDRLNKESGLERVKIFSADGHADFMRRELNALTQEEFDMFIKYHLAVCERPELLGAGSHVVDVLRK